MQVKGGDDEELLQKQEEIVFNSLTKNQVEFRFRLESVMHGDQEGTRSNDFQNLNIQRNIQKWLNGNYVMDLITLFYKIYMFLFTYYIYAKYEMFIK